MDDKNAKPEILIELAIAPKLQKGDPQMLEMVDNFLDRMITYRDNMIGKQQSKLEILSIYTSGFMIEYLTPA